MEGYKVWTHDYRSPIQGGDPVWDGVVPCELPVVELDRSAEECAAGWNWCRTPLEAVTVAGLWRDGWPCVLTRIEPAGAVVERDAKCRSEGLRIVERLPIRPVVRDLSAAFGEHAAVMEAAQLEWYEALGRPQHDAEAVERELRAAMEARGLGWSLRQYPTAWAARDAWAVRAARAAWAAWGARNAWAAWGARDAWDAWDAWDALTLRYAALMGWVDHPPDLLTTGIIDAYRHGLATALPTAPETLGWASVD
jgi:hypothetical protein